VNQVLAEGAQMAQLGWLSGVSTAVFLLMMIGWTWWAYRPSHRAMLEEAGRIPLDGGES
jgi:cbb3-type cytochrome oxidase subunit 3